jgi:AcrR family transcriptional regulator
MEAQETARDMKPHPHLHWVRPVQQARSQQTIERLLDAAETLIADKGFSDVTVAQIAARAGFSVGAVYSRFRDKQGLLHCLQDRFVDEAYLTTDAAFDPDRWEGASIEEIVSEMIVFLVEIHRERRGVLRELLGRTRYDASMVERRERLNAHISQRLSALLLVRAERIGHPDPEAAVSFGLRIVFGTLEQAILFNDTGAYGVPASDDKLAEELTRAFLGYLGVFERT